MDKRAGMGGGERGGLEREEAGEGRIGDEREERRGEMMGRERGGGQE